VNKNIETVLCPIADGGEGTVDALVAATSGSYITCDATGPLGEKINAKYGILGNNKTAVVEMAAASGLLLVPKSKRNPLYTTTYGTGDMIKNALDFAASIEERLSLNLSGAINIFIQINLYKLIYI
ncbi:unnamed protein product, partial [marine sediment metagenome]